MIITVDCNNDKVYLDDRTPTIIEMKCKHTINTLYILDEIFNRLNIDGITLIKIDEDERSIVGEW